MSKTDVDFIELIYTNLKEALRETLEEATEEFDDFSPVDVGMALGMLLVELGWTFGKHAAEKQRVVDRVRPTLRVIRSVGEEMKDE